MGMARGALLLVLVGGLCACWNGKDQFHHYVEEGRANGVPIIIYDISANDARYLYSQAVAIAFVNTEDTEIQSVVLKVAECGIKAAQVGSWTLNLGGGFAPDASYIIQPVSEPDVDGKQFHMQLSHMVITSVEVTDAGGIHAYSGEDVAKVLDRRIANYCAGNVI